MISMDHWPNDLAEGLNPHSRQQRSSLTVHRQNPNPNLAQSHKTCEACGTRCEGRRHPTPNPPQMHHQRKPPMGGQVTNPGHVVTAERLWCPPPAATNSNSNPSLEARVAGMSINEWWEEKTKLRRQALLDAVNGEEHYTGGVGAGAGPGEERKSSGREERRVSVIGEHNHKRAGEERKDATREERRCSTVGEHYISPMGREEVRKGNLQAGRAASLEVGVSGNTMKEWWSSLSTWVGTKRSRLHYEIVAFCKAHELTPEQARARRLAQDFLEREVLEIWPNAEVHLYGSTAMGLALPTSDIDIVVVMQPTTSVQRKGLGGSWGLGGRPFPDTGLWVSELHRKLDSMPNDFQSLTQIPHAKVPILKAVFKTGLACDISFDWHDNRPGQGVQIVRLFIRQYKALKPLCIVLKSFLRHHKLNEVFTGGIGSFCLTIMVVSLLQNLPIEGAAGNDLGALLVSFFMYYSCMHNYVTDVVSAMPGKHNVPRKQARGWMNFSDPERLAVENPLDPTSDVGSASYNIHDVRVKFAQAKRMLLRHWNDENLLDCIFKTPIT